MKVDQQATWREGDCVIRNGVRHSSYPAHLGAHSAALLATTPEDVCSSGLGHWRVLVLIGLHGLCQENIRPRCPEHTKKKPDPGIGL